MRRLVCFCITLLAAVSAAGQTHDVTPTSASRDVFQLTPAAPAKTLTVLVDRTEAFSAMIVAASRTLSIELTAPGGPSYRVGAPGPAGFESSVVPLDADGASGAMYLATIADPAPGTWRIVVTETARLAAPLDVAVLEVFNNDTQIVLVGGGDSFPLGKPVRFALAVFDGTQRLTGLTVTAVLIDTANAATAAVPLTFRDDGTGADEKAGDGIYEAFATPARPGTYGVSADATGTAFTGAFRRSAAGEFRVVRRQAEITGFTDEGVDDDFDGLYDRVVVSPAANLVGGGNYNVAVRLRASNGKEIQRTVEQRFAVGTAAPEVEFSAADLARDLGVDGPYAVAEVRYSRIEDGEPVPAGIRYNLGFTDAYTLTQLQHPRLRLTGTGTASGVDRGATGSFTELRVDLGVIAEAAGDYDYSVTLEDREGTEIGFITGTARLTAGQNILRLTFPGAPIGHNRVDGPYFVTNLLLFGEYSLVVNEAFTTQAFDVTQFTGYWQPKRRSVRH